MAKEKTKLCVITDPYELPIRGRINGPILTPSEFTMSEIRALLVARFNVFEVNPHNRKEKVKLTFANLNNQNYAPVKKERVIKKPTPPKQNGIFSTPNKLRERALNSGPISASHEIIKEAPLEREEPIEFESVDSPDIF